MAPKWKRSTYIQFGEPHVEFKAVLSLATAAIALTGAAAAAELGATDEPIRLAKNEGTGQQITTRVADELLRSAAYEVEYITAGNHPQHMILTMSGLGCELNGWRRGAAHQTQVIEYLVLD